MTGHDTTAPKAPPRLGADTGDVLKDVLGLDDERLASLAQKGIIAGG